MDESTETAAPVVPAPEAIPDSVFENAQRMELTGAEFEVDEDDLYDAYADVIERLERIEQSIEGLKTGVNTIGQMMNSVAEAFDGIMQKVNQGGIGALLGNLMGGKSE